MKKEILRWIAIVILLLLAWWFYNSFFTQEAKDCRAISKRNKVLRLMEEQRELQFGILQLDHDISYLRSKSSRPPIPMTRPETKEE